jgi:hypothetical protein
VKRLAVLAALGIVGTAVAGPPRIVSLPRPPFPGPATAPAHPQVTFRILSSTPIDPAQPVRRPRPTDVVIEINHAVAYGVSTPSGTLYDFRNFAWPPRALKADREFVYEEVVWAKLDRGTLLVETAHDTYSRSSYGRNAYVNAVDLKTGKLRWQSRALVANAYDFVVLNDTIVSGYGFTKEPDYLYALDRATGRVKGRVLLPSAPQTIARHGNVLTVVTYDHRVVVRVTGA